MANKSETLRQREKAQKDLLELKKMQKGELDPSTLKKDEKIVPRTFGEKVSHFFFYYKYVLLGCTALFVALAIILGSCIAKPNYDAKITVFCSEYVSEDVLTAMNEWLTSYYPDVNENGEVELLFADCSFSVETDQKSYSDNMLLKVQSLLASEKDAMLFILDEDNLKYLNGISKDFPSSHKISRVLTCCSNSFTGRNFILYFPFSFTRESSAGTAIMPRKPPALFSVRSHATLITLPSTPE